MAVEFKDYYTTLGVPRDASADDIKKAFRSLARLHHPDVAKDKATSEEMFKAINEANEVLSDPDKRKKYDRLGADWKHGDERPPPPGPDGDGQAEYHFGGTGFSDFFEQYFSGASRYGFADGADHARGRHAQRGSDIEGDILITLDEAMHGTVRPISMQTVNRQTGEVDTQSFKVRIPPGATDGRRIRVPGQGERGHGGAPAGDLFLRLRHAAHPDFTSRGADIYHDLEIAPWDAVLGAEIVVPTLDGSVNLRIPASSENGRKLRIRGRGLPTDKHGGRGNIYVVLRVQLPTTVSPAERELWEKLRDASTSRSHADSPPTSTTS